VDESVTLLAAFGAGLLSFISPCVLPFLPTYVSSVSGPPPGAPALRRLATAGAFVLGASIVFIALGASAGAAGPFLAGRLTLLGRVAGLIVALFGLRALGIVRLQGVGDGARRAWSPLRGAGAAGLTGAAFAVGWTPCIGPILAGVVALAGTLDAAGPGATVLAAYAAGLAVPFVAVAIACGPLLRASASLRRAWRPIEIAAGVLLVALGMLFFTDRFSLVAGWLAL